MDLYERVEEIREFSKSPTAAWNSGGEEAWDWISDLLEAYDVLKSEVIKAHRGECWDWAGGFGYDITETGLRVKKAKCCSLCQRNLEEVNGGGAGGGGVPEAG